MGRREAQQEDDLRRIRDAVVAVGRADHRGSAVFDQEGDPSAPAGVGKTGAAALLKMIDDVATLRGATAAFGKAAIITYGKWVFPGLRNDTDRYDTFESDALGSIRKDGRKSTVNTCALHPLQMVEKYYL